MTQQLEPSKTVSKHLILILLNHIFVYIYIYEGCLPIICLITHDFYKTKTYINCD